MESVIKSKILFPNGPLEPERVEKMAHHGIEPDDQFEDVLKNLQFDDSDIKSRLKKFEKPRAYPDGRLGAMDDGEHV